MTAHTVRALRTAALQSLVSVLDTRRPCALLDFPAHGNVGDSLIWLGARALLREAGAAPPAYRCTPATYSAERLARKVGNGTILLNGGGSFGDVWPVHQTFRERVLSDFPDNAIVQLPQSIHFESDDNAARAAQRMQAHSGFTLMVRDDVSRTIARDTLGVEAVLAPDFAFGLGPLPRPAPTTDVVVLARTDQERSGTGAVYRSEGQVVSGDWVEEPNEILIRAFRRQHALMENRPRAFGWMPLPFESLARQRLRRGSAFLGRGRAVVTDRLHGHILSLLMDIPNVVVDNSYGKNRRFLRTWTGDGPLTREADSIAEGVQVAFDYLPWATGGTLPGPRERPG